MLDCTHAATVLDLGSVALLPSWVLSGDQMLPFTTRSPLPFSSTGNNGSTTAPLADLMPTSIPRSQETWRDDLALIASPRKPSSAVSLDVGGQISSVTRRTHTCPTPRCSKTFTARRSVYRHVRSSHGVGPATICPYPDCEYHQQGSRRPDYLSKHIKRKHKSLS